MAVPSTSVLGHSIQDGGGPCADNVVPGTALQSLSNTAAPAPLEFCSLPFPLTKPRKGPPYSLLGVVRTLQPEVTLLHPLIKNGSFPLLLNQTQSCSAGSATGGPL